MNTLQKLEWLGLHAQQLILDQSRFKSDGEALAMIMKTKAAIPVGTQRDILQHKRIIILKVISPRDSFYVFGHDLNETVEDAHTLSVMRMQSEAW